MKHTSRSHIIYGSVHTCVQVCEILQLNSSGNQVEGKGKKLEDKSGIGQGGTQGREFGPTGRKLDGKCLMTQELSMKEEILGAANENKNVWLPDRY